MGVGASRTTWKIYWRYGPVGKNPLLVPLSAMNGCGEGMGPDGYWPQCTLEVLDMSGQPVLPPKKKGTNINGQDLLLRVCDASGKLLQELPLSRVSKIHQHKVAALNLGSVSKPAWTHMLFEVSDGSGLYVNGLTNGVRQLLTVLRAAELLYSSRSYSTYQVQIAEVSQQQLFDLARQAKLPIGPPGETEFKAATLHFGSRHKYEPVRGGVTNVYVGGVSAPGARGAGGGGQADDTKFFDLRNGPPPGLAAGMQKLGAEEKRTTAADAATSDGNGGGGDGGGTGNVDDVGALRRTLLNQMVRSKDLPSGRDIRGYARDVDWLTVGEFSKIMVGIELHEAVNGRTHLKLPAPNVELDPS
jgi:hypothetical protein